MKPKEPRFHGAVTERSHKNMSHIRGKDTSIEVQLRKALWHKGIRYRKNHKGLPGRPDIAITRYKIAIFCDSEFFHGKDWPELREKLAHGSNPDYWIPKIERNMERDHEHDVELEQMEWTVVHFWGKEIKKNLSACVEEIEALIISKRAKVADAIPDSDDLWNEITS